MAPPVQQVLQELSDLVPVVPPRVSEVLEAGEALKERMASVRERIEELRPSCEDLGEQLADTLRESMDQQEEDRRDWQEHLEDHARIREELGAAVEEARERLEPAAELAHQRLAHLAENFAADGKITAYEGQQVEQTRHQAEIARLRGRQLERLREELQRKQEQVAAALSSAHARVMTECERLAGRIDDLAQESDARLQRLEARTHRAVELLGASLDGTGDAAGEAAALALEGLRMVLGGQGCPGVLGPGDLLQAAMVEAGTAGTAASALAAVHDQARALVEPLFEGVSALLAPVELALGAVRGAASLVGMGQD